MVDEVLFHKLDEGTESLSGSGGLGRVLHLWAPAVHALFVDVELVPSCLFTVLFCIIYKLRFEACNVGPPVLYHSGIAFIMVDVPLFYFFLLNSARQSGGTGYTQG